MLAIMLLLACGAPSPIASNASGPPGPPAVTATPLVRGERATFQVTVPTAGATVTLVVSTATGRTCTGNTCVDMARPIELGRKVARRGVATFPVTMRDLSGQRALAQAVWTVPGQAPQVTPLATLPLLYAAGDEDRDGASNQAELRGGMDLYDPDTDGGGADDGQELYVNHTDPLDPRDDVVTEVDCANGTSDDPDPLVDCADPDCPCFPVLALGCAPEACGNRMDDDCDGAIDELCPNPEACDNGRDDDLDGAWDCYDADCVCRGHCAIDPACPYVEPCVEPFCAERCTNGTDDDGDGLADCADPVCGCGAERCRNGVDDDADGRIDCADPECPCVEVCGNGQDDDRDLRADCADPDCGCAERCRNGLDDDGDGLADCADPECGARCPEDCGNGADDDGDGLADCEDASCVDVCAEDCDNGADDNHDGFADCDDESCWGDAACPTVRRTAWITRGNFRHAVATYTPATHLRIPEVVYDGMVHSDVSGAVQIQAPGRQVACRWHVDRTRLLGGMYRREGVTVAPGCGAEGSSFLPTLPAAGWYIAGAPLYQAQHSISVNGGWPLRVYAGRLTTPSLPFGECSAGVPCVQATELRCDNGVDDDADGLVDTDDPTCPLVEWGCTNGQDDDLDGRVDCADSDCPGCAEICGNGVDDDGDRRADCADFECSCAELCGNGIDDDHDGWSDCEDEACDCVEDCANGVDDDDDVRIDCADPECGCPELCGNGADDDVDGLVDCEDGGCADVCGEVCDNGFDDDANGWADCEDEACWAVPGCTTDRLIWVEQGSFRSLAHYASRSSSSFTRTSTIAAEDVGGRYVADHGARRVACDWRMHGVSRWLRTSNFQPLVTGQTVERVGFRGDPRCPGLTSELLPAVWTSSNRMYLPSPATLASVQRPAERGVDTARRGALRRGPPYGVCSAGLPYFAGDLAVCP